MMIVINLMLGIFILANWLELYKDRDRDIFTSNIVNNIREDVITNEPVSQICNIIRERTFRVVYNMKE